MRLKFLVIFTVFSLLCQVIFGIYYSVVIVDQNILYNTHESAENRLTVQNQQLEINLSSLNSLSNTLNFAQNKPYSPINSTVNLK
jgi:hypothetical protein